jgi:predicted cupin superfamily sugar epimerase
MTTAGDLLTEALDLSPLPDDGGRFRQTFADAHHSTILFLLADGDFSALHRLTAPEQYYFLAGSPLRMLVIDDAGPRELVLDREHPEVLVASGSWQGSSSEGDWTLVSTQVTPAFAWSMFELGDRAELRADYPGASERITQLTRQRAPL